jgi:hypothetical protein
LHIWSKGNYNQGIGGKPEGKEALGRPRSKCNFVIKRNGLEV